MGQAMMGDFDFSEFDKSHLQFFGPVMVIIFGCFLIFVMLSMFVAIVTEGYEAARAESADLVDDWKHVFDSLRRISRYHLGKNLTKALFGVDEAKSADEKEDEDEDDEDESKWKRRYATLVPTFVNMLQRIKEAEPNYELPTGFSLFDAESEAILDIIK